MIGKPEFWVICVSWNFGAGKTFGTFLDLYALDKDEYYIIANVPYSIVDHYYSSLEDLLDIMRVFVEYSKKSNKDTKKLLADEPITKKIIFVLDEAQLAMWAREALAKNNLISQFKPMLTQCRKRRMKMYFITQRLTQIDIYIRRLCDFVIDYNKRRFFKLFWTTRAYYENIGDIANIETDESSRQIDALAYKTFKERAHLYSETLREAVWWIRKLAYYWNPNYQRISQEKHNTLHIVGFEDFKVEKFTLEKLEKGLVRWALTQLKHQEKLDKQKAAKAQSAKILNRLKKPILWREKKELQADLKYYEEELIEDLSLTTPDGLHNWQHSDEDWRQTESERIYNNNRIWSSGNQIRFIAPQRT